jgi:hypothetical protein
MRDTGERDRDAIYLLKRSDNGEPYHDPRRGDKDGPESWRFYGHELKDNDA